MNRSTVRPRCQQSGFDSGVAAAGGVQERHPAHRQFLRLLAGWIFSERGFNISKEVDSRLPQNGIRSGVLIPDRQQSGSCFGTEVFLTHA